MQAKKARVEQAFLLAAAVAAATPLTAQGQAGSTSTGVWVNRVELDAGTVAALEQQFGVRAVPGEYWYDAMSGAFGTLGGPGLGFTLPGLNLGGPLPADASGRGSGVFVNGRELHPMDIGALMSLVGVVYPGRYWLRGDGFYGFENGPPIGNLIWIAHQAAASSGSGYNRNTYFGHLGSDGQTSYFFDSSTGCSVISGGGVSC